MSLTCRRVKAQGSDKEYYWVQNSGVTPTIVDLYETLEDVPKEIRHYCENLDVITVGPGMADFMGIGDQLYPDFPICDSPKFSGSRCYAETCIYIVKDEWPRCPYLRKEKKA